MTAHVLASALTVFIFAAVVYASWLEHPTRARRRRSPRMVDDARARQVSAASVGGRVVRRDPSPDAARRRAG